LRCFSRYVKLSARSKTKTSNQKNMNATQLIEYLTKNVSFASNGNTCYVFVRSQEANNWLANFGLPIDAQENEVVCPTRTFHSVLRALVGFHVSGSAYSVRKPKNYRRVVDAMTAFVLRKMPRLNISRTASLAILGE
jgi:hypothetical protein